MRYLLPAVFFILAFPAAACEQVIVEGDTVKKVAEKLSCLAAENAKLRKQVNDAKTKIEKMQSEAPEVSAVDLGQPYKSLGACVSATSKLFKARGYQVVKAEYLVIGKNEGTSFVFLCGDSGDVKIFSANATKTLNEVHDELEDLTKSFP